MSMTHPGPKAREPRLSRPRRRLGAPRAAWALAVIGALAIPVLLQARVRTSGGNTRVAQLADEFADHWLAIHPSEARMLGFSSDRLPVPVTGALLDSQRVWHADFAHRLAEFEHTHDLEALSTERRADFKLLRARLDRELLDLDVVRSYETDPGRYVRPMDGALRMLLSPAAGPFCKNLHAVTRNLQAVPEALRAAMVGLKRPSRLAVDAARVEVDVTLHLCRHEIPQASVRCRDAFAMASLAEADTLAAEALEYFATWLGTYLLPRAGDFTPVGADVYTRLLRDETLDQAPLDSVEARVEREVDAARARCAALLPAGLSGAPAGPPVSVPAMSPLPAEAMGDSALLRAELRRRWPPHSARKRHPSRLRAVFPSPVSSQAWLDFASRELTRGPDATTDSALVLAEARQTLRYRARLLAELWIHAHGASVDSTAQLLFERCGLDSSEAPVVARQAALFPGRGAVVIGAWQIEALRDEVRARRGKRFDERAFNTAVLEQGPVPLPVVREGVLRRLSAWPG